MRSSIYNFFYKTAVLSGALLLICFFCLDYVGVWIQYTLIPIFLVAAFFAWLFYKPQQ